MSKSREQVHHAQWERKSEWLAKLRAKKEELLKDGIQGWDLMEAMTTLSLDHKISASQHRCQRCWHEQSNCICQTLCKLSTSLQLNDKLLILMHHKEFLSAGNSAKLLLQLFPDNCHLFLFGKEGDVDRLLGQVKKDWDNTIILWPGKESIVVQDFLKQLPSTSKEGSDTGRPRIQAVVLDGTYTQARNMFSSLQKRLGDPLPQSVQLRPTNRSIFHRAQKNYGAAHRQTEQACQEPFAVRTSTAEACGLLFKELGAPENIHEAIILAVKVNNQALQYARGGLSKSME